MQGPGALIGKNMQTGQNENLLSIDGVLASSSCKQALVRAGRLFHISDYDADVDTGAPKYWRITAPATGYIHCCVAFSAGGPGLFECYENPTLTGNGTALTAVNYNLNVATAATLVVAYDPTTSADGTIKHKQYVGSGSDKFNSVGVEAGTDHG